MTIFGANLNRRPTSVVGLRLCQNSFVIKSSWQGRVFGLPLTASMVQAQPGEFNKSPKVFIHRKLQGHSGSSIHSRHALRRCYSGLDQFPTLLTRSC